MSIRLAIFAALAGAAAVAVAQSGEDLRRYFEEGRKVAGQFARDLGGELRRELEATGPMRAIIVCKFSAPEVASSLSRMTGWRVSRVSLRTRNPALGQPDLWEQRVLAEFDRRAQGGEKAETLEFGEVVVEPGGRFFRYMKALPVERTCLQCHGPAEALSPVVKERLASDYPFDKATGYSVGQVRGAVTIKRPL
ncbi:MAG: DUF3365 domain-containing protein [Betaproteobacteria bacterium]|nr:DUF3365 domain-containing protein [Betaproteobacteria bacterium]MDH5219744.1 DUF3365 domain-containing protein [Betaproteobacteria bacterium]MDH5350491.1 DUF3365 domain-containing protein [Betaproteobacteria bacterium]